MQRLFSVGLAHDTPVVQAKLASKFPVSSIPPRYPALAPAAAPELQAPIPMKVLRSFESGRGPGSDGLRVDFLKFVVGENDKVDSFVWVLRDFVQLLADGRAPLVFRPWIGGGILIDIDKRDDQR